eukprot:448215-Hanusia_phi.AAC.1
MIGLGSGILGSSARDRMIRRARMIRRRLERIPRSRGRGHSGPIGPGRRPRAGRGRPGASGPDPSPGVPGPPARAADSEYGPGRSADPAARRRWHQSRLTGYGNGPTGPAQY